jgi:hypothetical protein
VNRSAVVRLGVKLLAGLGILPGQALSQGAPAPGGSAVSPAPRVAAPSSPAPILAPVPNTPTVAPSSPVVAPHPSVPPPLPTTTVAAPQPIDAGRPAVPHPLKGPSRWSNATPLPGVIATWSGPSGQGVLVTDGKGIVALGALSPGTYNIAFDTSAIATSQPSPKLLVGLLQPEVHKVRTVSRSFTPSLKGYLTVEIGPRGEPKTIRAMTEDGRQHSISHVDDAAAFAGGGRGIRLVFGVTSNVNTNVGR